MRKPGRKAAVLVPVAALALMAPVAVQAAQDWGMSQEDRTAANSDRLFGFSRPLASSATGDIDATSVPAARQVKLAEGLRAEKVASVAEDADMMAFWPTDNNPRYAFICIENDRAEDGRNPGVQRVDLRTGAVVTVVYGTQSCDGIRRTPWNTVLFTEETDDGHAYELMRPNDLDPVYILDRATGATSDPNVRQRPALGTMAWEGLHVYADGTVIAGDELRPEDGAQGGSLFKFTSTASSGMPSPLAQGHLAALRIGSGEGATNYGQGNERGLGEWVPIPDPAQARAGAVEVHATGFYRPEDLHQDPKAQGVRVCWTNTGNKDLENWGEVLCLTETAGRPNVQAFVLGNPELNQPDNLAFQPGTGNLYVIEDNPNGDIWACLPDGKDTDLLSDGCVRALSVRDDDAEPTGFTFDGSGRTAYLHIQHNDVPTADPMLRITGWTKP